MGLHGGSMSEEDARASEASGAPARPLDPVLAGARRLLAVRLDNVGDVVMLGPALRAAARAVPEAEITLLASPAGSQVAPLLPWVGNVIVRRVVWQDASGALPLDPGRELDLVRELAGGAFDAALIFTSFSQSPWPPAYACYLAGIPVRIGQAKDFGGSLLTHPVPALPDEAHQVDRNLHLVEAAGLPLAGRHLELELPTGDQTRAADLLAGAGVGDEPFVALAPGASCPARRYLPERFGAVARALAEDPGLPVVVVGSAKERDLLEPVVGDVPAGRIASLVGLTTVAELAAVIGRAALVLSNDSGPMHLADALDRPMVVLYSGTELESQWRPRGAVTRLLRRPTPCSPCYRFDCSYQLACLDIPPEEVVEHARELLAAAHLPAGPPDDHDQRCAAFAS